MSDALALSDPTAVALVAGSFLAALFSAAFSAGGAIIILAITTVVLPVSAVVPIHSTLLIGSTATRIVLFREYIDWHIAGPFLAGSAVGALAGARVYVELPDKLIATALAVVMIASVWLPAMRWRPERLQPWAIVGFIHSLLSTLFAYGAALQAIMLHTSLGRREVIGTMAGCLFGMSVFKITAYATAGFDYLPYLQVIGAGLVVAVAGTWMGRLVVDRISERTFRTAYRVLVTVAALRLVYSYQPWLI
jgi:uncharacterized membrane protein YfcA